MRGRWSAAAQTLVLSAALAMGCAREGGPAPETPALAAGVGGASGTGGGIGGASGSAGEGGHGAVSGGGSGGMQEAGVGGTGGAGGQAGVGGMNGGFGGAGGAAGANAGTCTDSDAPLTPDPLDAGFDALQPLSKGTTIGSNGTYEDSCNEDGDLIEHVCQTLFTCGGTGSGSEGACAPSPQTTGVVDMISVDCFGLCVDGACHVPCPGVDDELVVAMVSGAIDENVQLDSIELGLRYACTRETCFVPIAAGDALTVVSAEVPDGVQADCRDRFAGSTAPITLSDGCTYVDCYVESALEP